MPQLLVQRQDRRGSLLLLQCIIVALATAFFLFLVALVVDYRVAGLTRSSLSVGILHGLSQQIFLLATIESRSRGEPLRYAQQNLSRALAVVLAGAVTAAISNNSVLVLGLEALTSLLLSALYLSWQLTALRLPPISSVWLAVRQLKKICWRSSLTLLAATSLAFFLINIDRWMAADRLSSASFGIYTFGATLLMVAQSVQMVINAAAFPYLARCKATGSNHDVWREAKRISFLLLMAGSVLALPAWWAFDAAIGHWFNEYQAARALLPLFFAIAVLRVSDFWSSVLIISGQEGLLLLMNLLALLLGLGFWWWIFILPPESTLGFIQIGQLALILAIFSYGLVSLAALSVARAATLGVKVP